MSKLLLGYQLDINGNISEIYSYSFIWCSLFVDGKHIAQNVSMCLLTLPKMCSFIYLLYMQCSVSIYQLPCNYTWQSVLNDDQRNISKWLKHRCLSRFFLPLNNNLNWIYRFLFFFALKELLISTSYLYQQKTNNLNVHLWS